MLPALRKYSTMTTSFTSTLRSAAAARSAPRATGAGEGLGRGESKITHLLSPSASQFRLQGQRRRYRKLIDPLDLATGPEKRELLAKLAGNDNPWDATMIRRGVGTKECPTEIPSAFDCRIVGCVCDADSASVSWMMLYAGLPKRCMCGHWFTLVHKAPV